MQRHDAIPAYSESNLVVSGILPPRWEEEILAAVEIGAADALLQGGGMTSLESAGTDIPYRLLDGIEVKQRLPWLVDLYRGPLTALASRASGHAMVPSCSDRTGVNVNALDGPGGRYELHVDSNPVTGLLFVTGHDAGSGGQLLFEADSGPILIDPEPGLFITFDARNLPHAVTPLTGRTVRVSVPMNFYSSDEDPGKDRTDLNKYLYGSA
jgi:hypothetical protein